MRAAFESSHMIQDAVIRNLQVLAESTKRLSEAVKSTQSTIDRIGIAGFRNMLVHDYFSVDLGVVWKIVADDVPALKTAVLEMLASP